MRDRSRFESAVHDVSLPERGCDIWGCTVWRGEQANKVKRTVVSYFTETSASLPPSVTSRLSHFVSAADAFPRSRTSSHVPTHRLLILCLLTRRQLVYFINSELPWISSSAAAALGSVHTLLSPLSPPAAVIYLGSPPPFLLWSHPLFFIPTYQLSPLFTFNIHIFTCIYSYYGLTDNWPGSYR